MHRASYHLRGKGKRTGKFGRTMMQALELLQLTKRHISGQSIIEIKPVGIATIELALPEGIGRSGRLVCRPARQEISKISY